MDDTGAVVGYNEFDPYGNPVNNTKGGEPYGYTGEWYEGYIDLLHLRARWYSPYLNQFISPDTIVPDYFDPQSLNKYAYSRNNPVRYRDPSGYSDGSFKHLHLEVRKLFGTSESRNRRCGVTYKDLTDAEWYSSVTFNPFNFFAANIQNEIDDKSAGDTSKFDTDGDGYPDYIDGKKINFSYYKDSNDFGNGNFWQQTHTLSTTP